jgi:hypothetical protein
MDGACPGSVCLKCLGLDQQICLVCLVWNVQSILVVVVWVLITTKIVIREPCAKNSREYCVMSVKVEILSNSKAHDAIQSLAYNMMHTLFWRLMGRGL